MKYNINTNAKVQLTKHGAEILNIHPYNFGRNDYKEEDYYSSELWVVMAIFGEELFNGCQIPFVNNQIEIE